MALDHQKQKQLPLSPKQPDSIPDNFNGSFECNICLDSANDPVVTLCGHLYCWPCIYKWFYIQSSSLPPDEYPQCPICKSEISHTTVIPLYGRGQPPTTTKGGPNSTTPPRPPACGTRALLNAASQPEHQIRPYQVNPYQNHPEYASEETVSVSSSPPNVFQPVVGMFGEMVYARMFGNSQSLYTYPNSYHHVGRSSARLRRQEMEVDKSLGRISLFLLCCFLLSYSLLMCSFVVGCFLSVGIVY